MFGDSSEEMTNFAVHRKVYIERDITKQVARMLMLNSDLERKEYTFRVGNLIFHELGQVPTNLLDTFSTKDYIFPVSNALNAPMVANISFFSFLDDRG